MMDNQRHMFRSAVFVALQNEKGEFLLQRRINTGYMDEHYDLSATGHVEVGESLYEAAIREAKEEIGVIIQRDHLKPVLMTQMNVDISYLNLVFICEKWEGEPRIRELEKCDDIGWYSLNALPQLCTPTLRAMANLESIDRMQFVYISKQVHDQMMKAVK